MPKAGSKRKTSPSSVRRVIRATTPKKEEVDKNLLMPIEEEDAMCAIVELREPIEALEEMERNDKEWEEQ